MDERSLAAAAVSMGFTRAAPVDLTRLKMGDAASVRALCESNACGCYGANWMCPPGVGTVESCVMELLRYPGGIVVQFVGQMEDSFDMEGTAAAHARFRELLEAFLPDVAREGEILALGAGGCSLCEKCSYPDEPCRRSDRAMASVESYGVNVMRLCKLANLPYHSGQNTVTFTGLYAIHKGGEDGDL